VTGNLGYTKGVSGGAAAVKNPLPLSSSAVDVGQRVFPDTPLQEA